MAESLDVQFGPASLWDRLGEYGDWERLGQTDCFEFTLFILFLCCIIFILQTKHVSTCTENTCKTVTAKSFVKPVRSIGIHGLSGRWRRIPMTLRVGSFHDPKKPYRRKDQVAQQVGRPTGKQMGGNPKIGV